MYVISPFTMMACSMVDCKNLSQKIVLRSDYYIFVCFKATSIYGMKTTTIVTSIRPVLPCLHVVLKFKPFSIFSVAQRQWVKQDHKWCQDDMAYMPSGVILVYFTALTYRWLHKCLVTQESIANSGYLTHLLYFQI